MAQENVPVVRNLKTSKLFILLDEFNDRYRVINPEGAIVSLPLSMFSEDTEVVELETAEQHLSASQVGSYKQFLAELALKAEAEKRVEKINRARPEVYEAPPPPKRSHAPSNKPRNIMSSASYERVGIGASWSGSMLVFYKPQIDRLSLKQQFRVIVEDVGEFLISKQDFYANFNDVVLSARYKAEGYFAYDKVPEKAMRFLKK